MNQDGSNQTRSHETADRGMRRSVRRSLAFFETIGSGKLALFLMTLLCLFALAGAILPQQGMIGERAIASWQVKFPVVTKLATPLGLFDVFASIPFLLIAVALLLNVSSCVAARVWRGGGRRFFAGRMGISRVGFFLMHISLVLLLIGGVITLTKSLDGTILLTEGQTIEESARGYKDLKTGVWRNKTHTDMKIRLESVDVTYAASARRVGVASTLAFPNDENASPQHLVEVNRPLARNGLSFTQDDTGFSPRLLIKHTARNRVVGNSFIILDTARTKNGREYSDVVKLPLVKTPMRIVLYPTFIAKDNEFAKSGDVADNPMLELAIADKFGNFSQRSYARLGEEAKVGQFTVEFAELREWSSFRIGDDPGYPFVLAALWIGLIAMLLRYYKDLREWFSEWFCPATQADVPINLAGQTVPARVSRGRLNKR